MKKLKKTQYSAYQDQGGSMSITDWENDGRYDSPKQFLIHYQYPSRVSLWICLDYNWRGWEFEYGMDFFFDLKESTLQSCDIDDLPSSLLSGYDFKKHKDDIGEIWVL